MHLVYRLGDSCAFIEIAGRGYTYKQLRQLVPCCLAVAASQIRPQRVFDDALSVRFEVSAAAFAAVSTSESR